MIRVKSQHVPITGRMRLSFTGILIWSLLICSQMKAQEKLYANEFSLGDVTLLDGPFKHARDLNVQTLLQYHPDRLLAPYRKEAGLILKDSVYPNWEGLDGHIGGHYLSALAMNVASTNNLACKNRLNYMLAELKICQEANTINHPDWGIGYVGGVPDSKEIWSSLQKGDLTAYRSAWAAWYNLHKTYAGLRDAWLYAGNEDAKMIFLKFCDWAIRITGSLSEAEMQSMLDTEQGGMNEIFADASQMTGDERYLIAAKRFSHHMLLTPMSSGIDNLDNKHANTQIPKAIGFERIGELSHDDTFIKAGSFFWKTVTNNRTLVFGGNSRREFFPAVAACSDFVNDVEGPESCNSYNMLKLTEDLFRMNASANYVDYYERTLYNHILSTQHPVNGGYVYFTPVRPRSYRVYSSPNQAMWCCVGTGMENHSKYNAFIYAHQKDSLFLNLFIASVLNWKKQGMEIRQETNFPFEEKTKLIVTKGSSKFTLLIRYPAWVRNGGLKLIVNHKQVNVAKTASGFIPVNRLWKKGDTILISLPMHNSIEHLPNLPEYIALLHGPIVLGAKTGTEDLKGLVANDGRWGQIASGKRLPVDKAPIIIADDPSKIADELTHAKNGSLYFTAPDLKMINPIQTVFQPFFQIHDARYMIYWMTLSHTEYSSYLDSLKKNEKEKLDLQKRTVDFVATGEQQPEEDHAMQNLHTRSGSSNDLFWRDAAEGGFFSYHLSTHKETGLSVLVSYWGAEWGGRKFDIYIDDNKLLTEDNTGRWNQSKIFDVDYTIPDAMIKDKDHFRIKFQALPGNTAGAVYYIRLIRKGNMPDRM